MTPERPTVTFMVLYVLYTLGGIPYIRTRSYSGRSNLHVKPPQNTSRFSTSYLTKHFLSWKPICVGRQNYSFIRPNPGLDLTRSVIFLLIREGRRQKEPHKSENRNWVMSKLLLTVYNRTNQMGTQNQIKTYDD